MLKETAGVCWALMTAVDWIELAPALMELTVWWEKGKNQQ